MNTHALGSIPLFALTTMLASGACSSDPGEPSSEAKPETTAATNAVAIRAFAFAPDELEVAVATQVTWTNQDDILHTVTSGVPAAQGVPGVSKDRPAEPDGVFDEELDGAGSAASFTFERSGSFIYYCDIHPGMTGEISVT